MVLFRHPDGGTTSLDRYAWFLSRTPETHDVTARLNPSTVLDSLTDADFKRLFRRSMPVSTARGLVGARPTTA